MGFSELLRSLLGIIFWNIYWARSCARGKEQWSRQILESGELWTHHFQSDEILLQDKGREWAGLTSCKRARRGREKKTKWESAQRRDAERQHSWAGGGWGGRGDHTGKALMEGGVWMWDAEQSRAAAVRRGAWGLGGWDSPPGVRSSLQERRKQRKLRC